MKREIQEAADLVRKMNGIEMSEFFRILTEQMGSEEPKRQSFLAMEDDSRRGWVLNAGCSKMGVSSLVAGILEGYGPLPILGAILSSQSGKIKTESFPGGRGMADRLAERMKEVFGTEPAPEAPPSTEPAPELDANGNTPGYVTATNADQKAELPDEFKPVVDYMAEQIQKARDAGTVEIFYVITSDQSDGVACEGIISRTTATQLAHHLGESFGPRLLIEALAQLKGAEMQTIDPRDITHGNFGGLLDLLRKTKGGH